MFRDFGPISPSEPNNTALRLGNCVNRTSHALKITGQALYVIFSPKVVYSPAGMKAIVISNAKAC